MVIRLCSATTRPADRSDDRQHFEPPSWTGRRTAMPQRTDSDHAECCRDLLFLGTFVNLPRPFVPRNFHFQDFSWIRQHHYYNLPWYPDFSCLSFRRTKGPYGESLWGTFVPGSFCSWELSLTYPDLLFLGTFIPRNIRSQQWFFLRTFIFGLLYVFVVLLFVFRKSSDDDYACVRVVLLSNKKANCITVKLPGTKLIQAYGNVNQRRLLQ